MSGGPGVAIRGAQQEMEVTMSGDVTTRNGGMDEAQAAAMRRVAIGAVAIGRLAIGRVAVKEGRIKRLVIDELEVGRLRVRETITAERM